MSEDQRVARNPAEPEKHGPAGKERWADYLDWVRGDIARAVLALPEADQRRSTLPSGWSPIELLSHVLHMEQRWFVWGFLGEQVPDPWGDWTIENPWDDEAGTGRWVVPPTVSAPDLAERLDAIGRRTRQVLATHPLDTPGATTGRLGQDPPTLEWICFHVLAEYARHAGHLDVALEVRG